jgi:hypothetical protein
MVGVRRRQRQAGAVGQRVDLRAGLAPVDRAPIGQRSFLARMQTPWLLLVVANPDGMGFVCQGTCWQDAGGGQAPLLPADPDGISGAAAAERGWHLCPGTNYEAIYRGMIALAGQAAMTTDLGGDAGPDSLRRRYAPSVDVAVVGVGDDRRASRSAVSHSPVRAPCSLTAPVMAQQACQFVDLPVRHNRWISTPQLSASPRRRASPSRPEGRPEPCGPSPRGWQSS